MLNYFKGVNLTLKLLKLNKWYYHGSNVDTKRNKEEECCKQYYCFWETRCLIAACGYDDHDH